MDLEYVFGPVVATDTLLNLNIQFHRVVNRQQPRDEDSAFRRGWAWSSDDDDMEGDCTRGDYEVDPDVAIDDLCAALRDLLTERLGVWRERHPVATEREVEALKRIRSLYT